MFPQVVKKFTPAAPGTDGHGAAAAPSATAEAATDAKRAPRRHGPPHLGRPTDQADATIAGSAPATVILGVGASTAAADEPPPPQPPDDGGDNPTGAIAVCQAGCGRPGHMKPSMEMEWVQVAPDARGFVLAPSKRPFVPWGFNYDHDEAGRLLEEYWDAEWAKVAEDFREMQALGANVVRIHPQFGQFMRGPAEPNAAALEQLTRLVALAEQLKLRLDLTGLSCYLKEDVPAWYDELDEEGRWTAQAAFWEAIAARCADSPAIFCNDLMNEPVVPEGRREPGEWLGPPFAGKFHYVQFIALDQAGRPRPMVAAAWIRTLVTAIRRHDRRHLITVGLVDWSLDRPGLTSGFLPNAIAPELDFLSVHLYPETGRVHEALTTLAGFSVGKPVVIEETFPLRCSLDDMRAFLRHSRRDAAGWLSFYRGQPPANARRSGTQQNSIVAAWLELFSAERQALDASPPTATAPHP